MEDVALNAALASRPAPRVMKEQIEAAIARVDYHVLPGNDASPGERVTICQITLLNGFDVRGESACVDPANFDRAIGEHYAHEDAFKKLWPFFGFMLAERLHQQRHADQAAKFERMDAEMQSLDATEQPTGREPVPAFEPAEGMVRHVGTKIVDARPMTRAAYNELRGWDLPADENGDDEGYLVEYTDRVEDHVPGHRGYISWSPRSVFERAYAPV